MSYLIKAKGLYTYRNYLGVPEGALDIAENVNIDEDDIVQPRRGFGDYGDSLSNIDWRVKQIMTYKGIILRHYNNLLDFDNGSGTFTQFNGTYEELEAGLRLKYIEANSNLYFTTTEGIKKISARTVSDITQTSIEDAGVPKAVDLSAELLYAVGGFLPPQSKVAYKILWGKKDRNSNLLLGSPSQRFVLTNTSSSINISERFTITVTGDLADDEAAGNVILFSTQVGNYFVWFNSSSSSAPETSDTLGRTGIEVAITTGVGQENNNAVSIASALASLTELNITVASATVSATVRDAGNVTDVSYIDYGSASGVHITTTVEEQGSITEGLSANAQLTFTVPDGITTEYFYQVYRTAVSTVVEGLTLDDIDPGEEFNLCFESPITSTEIGVKEVIVEDITPDTFREQGAFLYINPTTGQGILQSNDAPPIAKDIALFRNSAFYANTKTRHRYQFNLLTTSNLTSGVSDLIIGNSSVTRSYTFVGTTETTSITCDTYANTIDASYILINSARDEVKYFMWFQKTSGTVAPTVSGRIPIRCDIRNATSGDDIANIIVNTLNNLGNFVSSATLNVVTYDNIKNGETTDATTQTGDPSVDIGAGWAINVDTQGTGEDTALGYIQLSNQVSVAQSIDETAQSIVKVINRDTLSPVSAYYLSGENDVPGIILFEAKDLTDDSFYLATSDSSIIDDFDSPLVLAKSDITDISVANPTEITTSAPHGYLTGDLVYLYNTDSTPALLGTYSVTTTGANTFTVPVEVLGAGTVGSHFPATVTSDNEDSPNRVYFSKAGQPEAVPLVNYVDIGPKDQPILRVLALRDNLFVLKSDGVYIITGSSAPDFTFRLLDGSTALAAPDSAVVLNNQIYGLTTQDIATITETGVSVISRPIEDRVKAIVNAKFNYKYKCFGVSYESDRSYVLWMPSTVSDEYATQCYRYNTFTRTWTRWTVPATCGVINSSDDKMYLGAGDRAYSLKERKNLERQDYSDRTIEKSFASGGAFGDNLRFNNLVDVSVGDSIVQTQWVTISKLRSLVRKLDADGGYSNDYESSVSLVAGIKMEDMLNIVNSKLVIDDSSITPISFSADFETQKDQYNDMIDEINAVTSTSFYKSYVKVEESTKYETWISLVDTRQNFVNVIFPSQYIEGPFSLMKSIKSIVQYAPQHFGDPSATKQIREGTFIFDQNNFYNAQVAYASDLSKNLEYIDFSGLGVGDWGMPTWGEMVWGGEGDDTPLRTLIPLEKQRCRYLTCRFEHANAATFFKLAGISLEPRAISKRGYR